MQSQPNRINLNMTEEDVVHELSSCGYEADILRAMLNVFKCKIKMGSTPFEAYMYTLECHLGVEHTSGA